MSDSRLRILTILFISLIITFIGPSVAQEQLEEEARKGDIETVQELLTQGVDIEVKNKSLLAAVGLNIKYEGSGTIKNRITTIAGVTSEGKEYIAVAKGSAGLSFPLPRATSGTHTQVIQLLLASGADVNVKDANGFTPLIAAAATGKIEIVDVLLKHGADPNAKSFHRAPAYGRGKVSALILASVSGFADIVQILLDHGANVNSFDGRRNTALYYSAWLGHVSTVKTLLRAQGIAVNAGKYLPLHAAIGIGIQHTREKDRIEIIKALLEHGADANGRDPRTNATLMMVAIGDKNLEIVKALLEHGADVKGKAGKAALKSAKAMGQKEITDLLKKARSKK
jgi:ankyrin repeat protein